MVPEVSSSVLLQIVSALTQKHHHFININYSIQYAFLSVNIISAHMKESLKWKIYYQQKVEITECLHIHGTTKCPYDIDYWQEKSGTVREEKQYIVGFDCFNIM